MIPVNYYENESEFRKSKPETSKSYIPYEKPLKKSSKSSHSKDTMSDENNIDTQKNQIKSDCDDLGEGAFNGSSLSNTTLETKKIKSRSERIFDKLIEEQSKRTREETKMEKFNSSLAAELSDEDIFETNIQNSNEDQNVRKRGRRGNTRRKYSETSKSYGVL